MPERPLVIQTESIDADAAAWLRDRCDVVECPWQDRAGLERAIEGARALLVRTYTRVDEALLARGPELKVVARAGVGVDNIDLAACERRGIAVVSTPGANTRAVVELVTAFMLDALRPRVYLDRAMEGGAWSKLRADLIARRQLSDLTLGLIGLGRVGKAVARVGAAMDMRVIYTDLLEIPPADRAGAAPMALGHVMSESDILSIHVDGRPGNRNLIDAAQLSLCRPDVLLINTSRGLAVDAPALREFLVRRPAAMAVLDVHQPEPFGPEHPLLGLTNARLTPHIGAATRTAHANMSWVVRDLWSVLGGEEPSHAEAQRAQREP